MSEINSAHCSRSSKSWRLMRASGQSALTGAGSIAACANTRRVITAGDLRRWRMKIKIQIMVESETGETAFLQEVAALERGDLKPDTPGLKLSEARSILAGIETIMVEQQVTRFLDSHGVCAQCNRQRSRKGRRQIVYRTPFGKLRLNSPRLYRWPCHKTGPKSFSPLAELLYERTSPELVYLETKFAALVSYGVSVEMLKEVLPISQDVSPAAIRQRVQHVAERLDRELGEQAVFINGCQQDWEKLPDPAPPLIVGIDGGYVHGCEQKSRQEGWFEVIVGKSIPEEDAPSKSFGFVSQYDAKSKRRLFEMLNSQGMQMNQVFPARMRKWAMDGVFTEPGGLTGGARRCNSRAASSGDCERLLWSAFATPRGN